MAPMVTASVAPAAPQATLAGETDPDRSGCSSRWNDSKDTASVTASRTPKSGQPVQPVRFGDSSRKIGQWNRYSP